MVFSLIYARTLHHTLEDGSNMKSEINLRFLCYEFLDILLKKLPRSKHFLLIPDALDLKISVSDQ
jgi:hypothetical protein